MNAGGLFRRKDMYKEVKLLTASGEKAIPMLANAATPIVFRRVFHQDLMIEIDKYTKAFSQVKDDPDALEHGDVEVDLDMAGKLAYVMSAAAEKAAGMAAAMSDLSFDGYMDWLESFEPVAFVLASADIFGLYSGNQQTSSTGKK